MATDCGIWLGANQNIWDLGTAFGFRWSIGYPLILAYPDRKSTLSKLMGQVLAEPQYNGLWMVFLQQIFTLYLILPNPSEVQGNLICWATNSAVIELEAVFKGQLGLLMAKVCTDKLLHIWSYWLLLKQAASSQTEKFWLISLLPVVQLKNIVLTYSYFLYIQR